MDQNTMGAFGPDVTQALQAPLDAGRVKTRSQSGSSLSYLEGYDVIDHLNKVFGFGGWDHEVRDLVFQAEAGAFGGYRATVCISVNRDGAFVARSDVGFGIVQSRKDATQATGEAHEMAVKTAVTDAMKRAARTFGDQFGNGLYDKDSEYHKGNQGAVQTGGGFGKLAPAAQAPAQGGGFRRVTG